MSKANARAWAGAAYRFLGSLGLATILFLLLLLLTFLGTLEQKEHGLYAAQEKYFQSFFLVHRFFGAVPMALPGAYALLILLAINTFVGGLIRVWGRWRRLGLFVTHAGVLVLLAGGFITSAWGVEGSLTLFEGESSRVVRSHRGWELVISAHGGGDADAYVVPGDVFEGLGPGQERTARPAGLPFEVTLSGFVKNAVPIQVEGEPPEGVPAAGGYYLRPLPPEPNAAAAPGLRIRVDEAGDGPGEAFLLWAGQRRPMTAEAAGSVWDFRLRPRQWQLPFEITLADFTRELHPGTNMPSAFRSTVIKTEDGMEQRVRIAMNEPLRHRGYTLYQASWGPPDAAPGEPLYSTFAVVRNPAAAFPMYACVLITLGMVLHYGIRLTHHLRRHTGEAA